MTDGIKVVNQLTSKWGDYPGLSRLASVVTDTKEVAAESVSE